MGQWGRRKPNGTLPQTLPGDLPRAELRYREYVQVHLSRESARPIIIVNNNNSSSSNNHLSLQTRHREPNSQCHRSATPRSRKPVDRSPPSPPLPSLIFLPPFNLFTQRDVITLPPEPNGEILPRIPM